MWILWLATGANATHAARVHFFSGGCSFCKYHISRTGSLFWTCCRRLRFLVSGFSNTICNEFRVVEAFAYINFIIRASFPFLFFCFLRDIFSALLHHRVICVWVRARPVSGCDGPNLSDLGLSESSQHVRSVAANCYIKPCNWFCVWSTAAWTWIVERQFLRALCRKLDCNVVSIFVQKINTLIFVCIVIVYNVT